MISVTEARSRILAPLRGTGTEIIGLAQAWNRVLAQDVFARLTQPPADISAMDGYALRAADGINGAVVQVVGEAPAGHPFGGTVATGQAVRLFTGSVIPAGADCVVLQEDVAREGEAITLREAARRRGHIRPQGQDFVQGARVLTAGRRLGARDIGLAAAANHAWLGVARRPVVAILSTGDEIALPGEPVPIGGIISSNAHMLAAVVRGAGGEPLVLPVARDTPDAIAAAIAGAPRMDLLVTTGGASVGDHDVVQAGLARLGFTLDFWKVAMRPGKPMISGMLEGGMVGGVPVLGLPGNPVSAFVCAILFLSPAIERLLGLPAGAPRMVSARAGAALRANDHRADHLRARLAPGGDGGLPVATAFERQDSGMLSVLAEADCLIVRAPHAVEVRAGEVVEVIPIADV